MALTSPGGSLISTTIVPTIIRPSGNCLTGPADVCLSAPSCADYSRCLDPPNRSLTLSELTREAEHIYLVPPMDELVPGEQRVDDSDSALAGVPFEGTAGESVAFAECGTAVCHIFR